MPNTYLVKQIPSVVNDAVKDALGKSYEASQLSSTDIVSMGKAISQYNAYEGFFKSLVNRLVKTVYFVRSYEGRQRSVLRDEHEYGAFIQKVYYDLPNAVDNATWAIPNEDGEYHQSSPYDVEGTVGVTALIFGGKGTWSIEILRPVEQIKSAFLDPTAMNAFIDGIYVTVDNAFKLEEERLTALAVNTAMADSLDGGKARNLLAEFNDKFNASLTPKSAITNADFLRFASKEINRTITNMSVMSTAYNKAGYSTFTTKDNMVVEMLSEFASSSDMYLQSDTFHKELVALPNYESVPFWQTSGATFDFDDCSSIDVVHADLDSEEVKQSGIICFIHDIENVACYFGNRRTWEMFNPRSEVMIHGEKAEKGFAVDNHANATVFYLGSEGTATLTQPASHGTAELSTTKVYRGNPIIITVTPDNNYVTDTVTIGDEELEAIGTNKYVYLPKSDEDVTIVVTVKSAS